MYQIEFSTETMYPKVMRGVHFATEAEAIAFAEQQLATYKWIKTIRVLKDGKEVASFPKTLSII